MKTKKLVLKTVYHVLVIAFGFVMIYPVLWMISGSFKDNSEILRGGVPPPVIIVIINNENQMNMVRHDHKFGNKNNIWINRGYFLQFIFYNSTFYIRNRHKLIAGSLFSFEGKVPRQTFMVYMYACDHDAAGTGYYDTIIPYMVSPRACKQLRASYFPLLLRSGIFHLPDDAVYVGHSQRTG